MFQRKQSVRVNDGIIQIPLFEYSTQNTNQNNNSSNINNANANQDEIINESITLDWIHRKWPQTIIRICALLSFISICANTPSTIENHKIVLYATFIVDSICSLLFTIEMIAKIRIKGLCKTETSYIFDRWCQFDFIMVIFHWISVSLHIFELLNPGFISYWSILRSPRPLILIRVIRAFLKFRLPKNRINSILQRSSSQIYNVTIFFLFFMALYGILGVQFFGELTSHCVKNDTDENNVYLNDLMIPDTYCTTKDGPNDGYQCPPGMKCIELSKIKREDRGFNGFDELVTSIFTVYEAASQEGWVFLMYRATDSLPSWRAYFYFITMIFFLAWLVKNVFIAVIIETFAEIRVQFQQMWGNRSTEADFEMTQVFERKENGILKLVTKDKNEPQGAAPDVCLKMLRSSWFNMVVLSLVLANGIITATIKHTHKDEIDRRHKETYKYIETVFTILFDLEVLFKVFCLSFKTYIKRSIHKFEFVLAVGTTLRLIPYLYETEFTYFQVLRIVRLIKSSPMLENFVNKIFGPGKKLGSLIIFTMCLLIITSCVSMQLFCFLGSERYKKFDTFDQAFMNQFAIMTNEGWTELMFDAMKESVNDKFNDNYIYTSFIPIYFIFCHMFCSLAFMTMFQILTQKGWLDIMHLTMRQATKLSPLVAIYFISYHLFVTLIVLSLFVAVILDNLELDEDVKKIKQLKQSEQSAETQEILPWRLRIFEKFPNRPQMVSVKRFPNEFHVPKIRESFMKQFLDDSYYTGFEGYFGVSKSALDGSSVKETNELGIDAGLKSARISISTKTKTELQKISEFDLELSSASTNKPFNIDIADFSENMVRRRKINTPNAQAAQLRALNNLRMQRACRYSMKKVLLSNIVSNSNSQRLLTDTNERSGLALINPKLNAAQHSSTFRGDKIKAILPLSTRTVGPNGVIGSNKQGLRPIASTIPLINTGLTGNDIDFKMFQYKKQQAELKRNQMEDDLKENHPYFDKPLFLIGRNSNLRKFCLMIVEAKYSKKPPNKDLNQNSSSSIKIQYNQFQKFISLVTYLDWIMILVTVTSCISIAFESPNKRIVDNWQLQVAEYLFVASMSIEMALKMCAYGLFFTPKALIKDFGGILDAFIYTISLLFLLVMPHDVAANSGAQILMLLRCLRPLRIFTLVPHMRKVIYELCRGFKEILLVTVLLVVLIFIFANYGVQIYGGKLAQCNDKKISHKDQCTGLYRRNLFITKLKLPTKPNTSLPGIWAPRVWANPYNFDFDTISHSMLALFEVLSLEGWLEVRDIIIERMGGTRHAIFVHVFVFIGTLIGLTLFVGVVITNYSENKGTALLTVDQRRWLDLKGRIKLAQPLHIPPRPEDSKFRAFMFDITQHKWFKRLSAFGVLLNCGLLYVPWKENDDQTKVLATIAAIFTVLFLLEAIMKMIALGPGGYWQSRRNRFDLFVTFLGFIWIFMHFISLGKPDLQKPSNAFGFVVIVLRFFTIAGKHATLKMLMLTIIVSFFKSFFIILGMFLLMLVYAFAGVILFGCVKSGHDLGRHANFKSSVNAIILLMRIVTGEDWNKIMHDCMIAPPACTKAHNYWDSDCGNFPASLLYFCSFYVIITYIVLNLLVAIIMENFSLFYSNEEDALLSYSDIRHFQIIWNMVDIHRKGFIPCKRVKFLLRLLRGRLEVDLEKDRLLFKHMCYEIEKLNNGGDVTFHDVLNMLSYRSVDIRKSLKLEELLVREELEFQIEEEVAKQTIRNWLDKCLRRIREKDKTNIIKSLQKQNDIAMFKEQMGAKQHLLTQPIASTLLTASQAQAQSQSTQAQAQSQSTQLDQQQQKSDQQQQQQNQQLLLPNTQPIKSEEQNQTSTLSANPLNQTTTNLDSQLLARSDTSLNQKQLSDKRPVLQRTASINSNSDDYTSSFKHSEHSPSYKDDKRRMSQKLSESTAQQNEDKEERNHKLKLETQLLSNDVKNWWNCTINDLTNSFDDFN